MQMLQNWSNTLIFYWADEMLYEIWEYPFFLSLLHWTVKFNALVLVMFLADVGKYVQYLKMRYFESVCWWQFFFCSVVLRVNNHHIPSSVFGKNDPNSHYLWPCKRAGKNQNQMLCIKNIMYLFSLKSKTTMYFLLLRLQPKVYIF